MRNRTLPTGSTPDAGRLQRPGDDRVAVDRVGKKFVFRSVPDLSERLRSLGAGA